MKKLLMSNFSLYFPRASKIKPPLPLLLSFIFIWLFKSYLESESCLLIWQLPLYINCLWFKGQWRKWMLQLTTFLIHQNGSIHEGLNLWKKNVDKRFEGVEVSFSHIRARNYLFKPIKCYSQLLSDCLDLYRYQCKEF